MPTKYRMTGCAKFFIFLIIAAPLAFLGANYVNHGDPFAGIPSLSGNGSESSAEAVDNTDIQSLEKKIRDLEKELQECRDKLPTE